MKSINIGYTFTIPKGYDNINNAKVLKDSGIEIIRDSSVTYVIRLLGGQMRFKDTNANIPLGYILYISKKSLLELINYTKVENYEIY